MSPPRQKTVLIIDDEEDFCFFAKANLQQLGPYQVLISTDGEAGLRMAKKLRPDIVLLDVMMPEISGLEILEALKDDPATRGIPVIMLTARDDEETKRAAAELYDDDYLIKPVPSEVLKERIDSVLARIGRK